MVAKLLKKISLGYFVGGFGVATLLFIVFDCNWYEDFKHLTMDIFSLAVLVGVIEWLHDKNASEDSVKAALGDFIYDKEIYIARCMDSLVTRIDEFLDSGFIETSDKVIWFGSKTANPFLGVNEKVRELLVIHRISPVAFDKYTNDMLKDCKELERRSIAFYERYKDFYGPKVSIDAETIPTERSNLIKMKELILKRKREDLS